MNVDKIISFIELIEDNNFTLEEWNYLVMTINKRFDCLIKKVGFTTDESTLTLYGLKDIFKSKEKEDNLSS